MEQTMTKAPPAQGVKIDAPPVRYCLYARKSTEDSERQALSIESQIKEMTKVAERDNLYIADIRRESHSAKAVGQRPMYNQLVEDIRQGQFDGILAWAPDRLSRNAGDLGLLVDLMDQKILREIRTYSQVFTNDPNQKFLLMILGSQAKLENDNRSVNTKRGMRARVEMGLWPGQAPTGYLNEKRTDKKCHVIIDPDRAPIIKKLFEKIAYEDYSGRSIYKWLKEDLKFKTKTGKALVLGNVYRLIRSTFYYGVFEYPKSSGNFYNGIHEPIITKDLFDKVQGKIIRSEMKSLNKEFTFVKLITCGCCGSGVTADEKIKHSKDGGIRRYTYYGCTGSRDINCKNPWIREDELAKQLLEMIDQVDLDKLGIKEKIQKEMDRYYKFRQGVFGIDDKDIKKKDADIRKYAKYLLTEGNVFEKRELLTNLKSKLILLDRTLKFQE